MLLPAFAVFAALAESGSPSRWAFDGGFGVRLWNDAGRSPEERAYLDQGRVGLATSLDVSVYPWNRFGIGLLYAQFFAAASDPDLLFPNQTRGPSRDDYTILYAAPALFYAAPFGGGRGALVFNAGPGIFFYRNESEQGAFPGVLEGNAPGFHAAASAEYRIRPRLAFGVGLRALQGQVSKMRYNAMDVTYPEISLTRFDVTAGLRFYP